MGTGPLLRYSVTPLLRYSVTPLLRYSVTPLLRYSVTPLLRYSVTNEVTFLSNDVTDRYFLFTGNGPSNGSYFFGPLLRYFLVRYSVTPLLRYSVTRGVTTNKYLIFLLKRTLRPYFRNLPLLHITIRLHLIWRLLKFMQWLARKQYLLCRRTRQI